ncbi:MAG: hydroxymethylbilane synthase [Phycisphaerales bacterium]|nr:MAG: hydroxymethylbilane synthase [Phycisphaerales bacterium]
MTRLRVGTRGSELALWQTRWVCRELTKIHPSLHIEEVIIRTHGDKVTDRPFGGDWPVGAFVRAIEQALMDKRVDFAVHSHKDLQTAPTAGLVVAAVPRREAVHDVLLTRERVDLDNLPAGFRLGTSSPRRSAQFRRLGGVVVVPIRGNVPTRVAKLTRENLDGVVMAAAGLERLGIRHEPRIDLPTERFVPAPGQGALAVQALDASEALEIIRPLDDGLSRLAVEAERSFLRGINAGCHTPAGALATVEGVRVSLRAQLFSDDGGRMVEGVEVGEDATAVGLAMARRLLADLASIS